MTAFVDVNVVPMDRERVLAHQTVVVEGERITVLGPNAKVKVPAGAVRIDGRGKYLMPGLGDMHVHGATPPPADEGQKKQWQYSHIRRIAMGITSARSLDEAYGDELPKIRQYFATGEFPTLRQFLARAARLPVSAARWAAIKAAAQAEGYDTLLMPRPLPPESLAVYVAAAKAAGYDHIAAPRDVRSPQDLVFYDSLAVAARRAGLPVSAHSESKFPLEAALALGPASGAIEHVTTVASYVLGAEVNETQVPPAMLPTAKLREVVTALGRAGVWMNPTMECLRRRGYSPYGPQVLKALQAAGVPLLVSGDMAGTVHHELLGMVQQAGFSPYQALLTGTRNVAAFFRREQDLGTVTVGKLADLVLLSGNPLADINRMWEPAGVMINGRWLDRVALDQALFTAVVGHPMYGTSSPWHWILQQVQELIPGYSGGGGPLYPLKEAQTKAFLTHHKKLVALGDSLAALPSLEKPAAERLRGHVAAEFGAMRQLLNPEQRTTFDPLVRLWLREQVRQGYQVTVPGVAPVS